MLSKELTYCLFLRKDLAEMRSTFFDVNQFYGMKSDVYMYQELKAFLNIFNISLNTQYENLPEQSDVIICINETDFFTTYTRTPNNKLIVLILTEPPVYNETDWLEERHCFFDKVFTYNTDLVAKDKNKYKYLAYPIELENEFIDNTLSEEEFDNKKHSCLIAAAFAITKGKESHNSLLYTRYKILKWYNKNAPTKLDYYARIHPEAKFQYFRGASIINKINSNITKRIAALLYRKNMSSIYKGNIPGLKKSEMLASYKFNFCLENSAGTKGYITEKIFECFYSKTVPIYMGAPDIDAYIPKNCYVAFSDFLSMEDLQNYLLGMTYKTYINYLLNATAFLNSTEINHFSTKKFIEKIYKEIKL